MLTAALLFYWLPRLTAGQMVSALTEETFDTEVKANEDWFVMFHAPWCGHCKSFKPTFEEAAEGLKGKTKFGLVDCTEQKSLCERFDVHGFPTLKFHRLGEWHKYQGSRAKAPFIEHTQKMRRPGLLPANQDELELLVTKVPEYVTFVLVGDPGEKIIKKVEDLSKRLMPTVLAPTFLKASNFPGDDSPKPSLTVLRHGQTAKIPATGDLEAFVNKWKNPLILDLNVWWRVGMTRSATLVFIVTNSGDKDLVKARFLKPLVELAEEFGTVDEEADPQAQYSFGYVVGDENDISGMLKSFGLAESSYMKYPLFVAYDRINYRYTSASLAGVNPSDLRTVFDLKFLSDDSEWIEVHSMFKKMFLKFGKFMDGLSFYQTLAGVVVLACVILGLVVFCTSDDEWDDQPGGGAQDEKEAALEPKKQK